MLCFHMARIIYVEIIMFFVTGNRYADLYVQNFESWLLYMNRHFLTLHSLGLVWKETRKLEDRTMNRAKPIADAVYGVGGISTKGARNCQNRFGIRFRATGPVKPVKPDQANKWINPMAAHASQPTPDQYIFLGLVRKQTKTPENQPMNRASSE